MHESGKRAHPGKIIFWSLFVGFVAEFLAALFAATRTWPKLDDGIWITLLGMVGPCAFYGAHVVSTFVLRLRGESLEATQETIWNNERRWTREAPPVEEFTLSLSENISVGIEQDGIGYNYSARWARIKECRIHRHRNAIGNWGPIEVDVHNDKGRVIIFFGLGTVSPKEQQKFLLALHRALQPHAPEPDLSQVLGERDEPQEP